MEITACPNCGSKNIGIGTLGDGIISGLSSWKEVCKDCGYQGASLLFDSENEYKKFIDALSNAKKQTVDQKDQTTGKNAEEEFLDLTKKEKRQVLEFLDETEDTHEIPKKKNYFFEFLLAVILSIMFFITLLGGRDFGDNNVLFSDNDLFVIVLYIIGSFIGVLIFFFLLIALVETIYRSARDRKKNN